MEELRNKLFEVVNGAKLPPEAIYYICKDFFREVQDEYNGYLMQQKQSAEMAAQTALAAEREEKDG